jgi:phosphopantothenate synthetase
MNTASPLCHEALLTLARKLEAAAADDDRDRVEHAASRLLGALVDHIRAEKAEIAEMGELDPDRARDLVRGQERIVDHLVPLAAGARDADLSVVDGLALRLIAELSLQADDERRNGLAEALR